MSLKKEQIKVEQKVWTNLFHYLKDLKSDFVILVAYVILLAVLEASFPLFTQYAIDHYVEPKALGQLWQMALVYVIFSIIISADVFLFIRQAGKIEMKIVYKMRKDCFNKLQRLSLSYYDQNAVGWMIARTTSDVGKISETVAWAVVDLLWGFVMMVTISVIMLIFNVKLALVTLAVVPLLAIISIVFEKKMLVSYRMVRKINSKITGFFNEGIVGAKTSKTLVREDENHREFGKVTQNMKRMSVRAASLSAGYLPMALFISAIGMVMTLYFGSHEVMNGWITYGTLALFITYARQFFDPVLDIARTYTEVISAQAAAERVMQLIDEEEEIIDTEKVLALYGDHYHQYKDNWESIKGDISFDHVSFAYTPDEPILKDFNLKVKQGETIALVGETGSGKSTIVNLACRFYEPSQGRILIDGVDYKERSQSWLHANIGYVLQSPHLFSGTIRDNIKYGKLQASDEEMIEAAKLVNAHHFIEKLEHGYDMQVGEGGSLLSTGEKQLISFARAILASPKFFFLDEATSSIDTETEMMIQEAIDKLLENRTSFIVAHRLSTIRNADRILVIDKGQIIEEGSHESLIRQKGHYYELYANQFIEEGESQMLENHKKNKRESA